MSILFYCSTCGNSNEHYPKYLDPGGLVGIPVETKSLRHFITHESAGNLFCSIDCLLTAMETFRRRKNTSDAHRSFVCKRCGKAYQKINGYFDMRRYQYSTKYCSESCFKLFKKDPICNPCVEENKILQEVTFVDGTKHLKKLCPLCLKGNFVSKRPKKEEEEEEEEEVKKPSKKKNREIKFKIQETILKNKYGESFYTSRAWLEVRFDALRNQTHECVLCGSKEKPFHVDHIKPRSKYPELALEPTNLQILCKDCNLGKGSRDETDFRTQDSSTART